MLVDAGYEPMDDWVFIEDLIESYRSTYADRTDLLSVLDQFLLATEKPVTRGEFKAYSGSIQASETSRLAMAAEKERLNSMIAMQKEKLTAIFERFGIVAPEAGHEALALRIIELEKAVKEYADRVRLAKSQSIQEGGRSSSAFSPFVAGVLIGGALF